MKSAFFTRAKANEGIKLSLALPDGTPTKFWMRIRGVDSDAHKAALSEIRARAMELMGADDKKTIQELAAGDVQREDILTLFVSLVADWNMEDDDEKPLPCTPENVRVFLREAPQIADRINEIATRRKLFFGKSLTPFTDTPKPNSSSPSPSQEASLASPSVSS